MPPEYSIQSLSFAPPPKKPSYGAVSAAAMRSCRTGQAQEPSDAEPLDWALSVSLTHVRSFSPDCICFCFVSRDMLKMDAHHCMCTALTEASSLLFFKDQPPSFRQHLGIASAAGAVTGFFIGGHTGIAYVSSLFFVTLTFMIMLTQVASYDTDSKYIGLAT